MKPIVVNDDSILSESTVEDGAQADEMRAVLDKRVPLELRGDYLRLLDGAPIPKGRKEVVRLAILDILREEGFIEDAE